MTFRFRRLLLGAFLCGVAVGVGANPTSDEEAVDRVRIAFNTAINGADIQALAALIDEHAVWMQPTRSALIGRAAILDAYAQRFSQAHPRIDLQAGETLVSGDLAILHGRFERTDAPSPAAPVQLFAGHYMMALRKQHDGTWMIIRDIWNESGVDASPTD